MNLECARAILINNVRKSWSLLYDILLQLRIPAKAYNQDGSIHKTIKIHWKHMYKVAHLPHPGY